MNIVKSYLKKISILFLGAFIFSLLGYILLIAVYCLPTQGRMKQNMFEAKEYFQNEGNYPNLTQGLNGKLDNFTDSLMMNIATYPNTEGPFVDALTSNKYIISGVDWVEYIANEESGDTYELTTKSYGKYWNGYLVLLKPLLWIFSYGQIRSLLCALHLSLFLCLACLLIHKKKEMIIPLLGMEIFINPVVVLISLQFSMVINITYVASIFLLLFYEQINKKFLGVPFLFLAVGCCVNYLDLLTYPAVSLGVPLAILLLIEGGKDNLFTSIKRITDSSLAWLIGFSFNWFMKWVYATAITQTNYFDIALSNIKHRLSSKQGDIKFSVLDVYLKQFEAAKQPTVIAFIFAVVIAIVLLVLVKKIKVNVRILIPYSVVALIPFVWYALLKNHSYVHNWYTYRCLSITMFSLLAGVASSFVYTNQSEE